MMRDHENLVKLPDMTVKIDRDISGDKIYIN